MTIRFAKAAFPVLLAALLPAGANAEDDMIFGNMEPTTKAECSACHNPYPAQFLPAESWNRILDTLSDHFGEDASLAPEQIALIRSYLNGNSATNLSGIDPYNPPLRITELPWFSSEHGARLTQRAKADPAIGTMSNCAGCHTGFK